MGSQTLDEGDQAVDDVVETVVAQCAGGIRWISTNEVVLGSWFKPKSRKSAMAKSFSLSETAGW